MVTKAAITDFFREIRKSFSRFISITLLLMLAVAFFSGLRVTKPDMRLTADKYMAAHSMYDIEIMSTLGLTGDDIAAISKVEGVSKAEGLYQIDAIAAAPDKDIVITMLSLSEKGLNTPELLSGHMPAAANECLVEEGFLKAMKLKVGASFKLSKVADAYDDALLYKEFTITGTVRSPEYMSDVLRGSSSLGSGNVSAFILIPKQFVNLDYYTMVDLTVAGASSLNSFNDAYKDTVKAVKDRVKLLEADRVSARIAELTDKPNMDIADAEKEIADKETELDNAKADIASSKATLEDAKFKLIDGQNELDASKAEAEAQLGAAKQKLDDAETQIEDGKAKLKEAQDALTAQKAAGEKQFSDTFAVLDSSKAELDKAQATYDQGRKDLDAQLAQWNALPESVRVTMPDKKAQLDASEKQLGDTKALLDQKSKELNTGYDKANAQKKTFEDQITSAQQQLDAQSKTLAQSETDLKNGRTEYERQKANSDAQIADAQQKLSNGAAEIESGEQQIRDAEAKITDGETQLKDGKKKLTDAKKKIADIPAGKWYILDRNANAGFVSYGDDSDRMGALANIFPIIFFAVAALVCLTTMTRMVDEKRAEIGAYKALGHSRLTTSGKFIFYSVLAAAIAITGGLFIGNDVLPRFIFKAYSVMYDLPPLETPYNLEAVVVSIVSALICTVGATLFACIRTLRETPASLLRPKAPTPGKRVLLERITPLWKRMSFFAKVSARNIFRYKKRLIMTLIGIAGSTALVVTGFGLRDSIFGITDKQFGEILKYDLQVNLVDKASENDITGLRASLADNKSISEFAFVNTFNSDISSGTGIKSANIVVPENPVKLEDLIKLGHRTDKKVVKLSDSGAIITEKLADQLRLKAGDTFTVDKKYTMKVADVIENYVYNYIYVTPAYYAEVYGKAPALNQVLVKCTDGGETTANSVSAALLKESAVSDVHYFQNTVKSFRKSMSSVNYVVYIILGAAGLLAFIVLYNLTNINIMERIRELATIKVLGFYDGEVSWYIFRENTILTGIGVVLGLIGGKYMHAWLIKSVEVDIVMFGRAALPLSYVWGALLTFAFAVIVNVIGHMKMRKINMVEALKTNE